MRLCFATVLSLALIGAAAAQDAPAPAAPDQAPAAGESGTPDDNPPPDEPNIADPTGKLPKPTNAVEYAPTAEKVRFDFLSILNPDCSSMGALSYRILVKPNHGELAFSQDQGFPNFKDSNVRSRCNATKVPGLSIYYRSTDGYVGEDTTTILFLYPDASADVMQYEVVVR